MFRAISLAIRFLQSFKERKKMLAVFSEWHHEQQQLHNNKLSEKKMLLIIRLDDIGDYLLFRNSLQLYKESPKWKDHTIHLLGNSAWKELFETFDSGKVDESSWINKSLYFNDENYRVNIWKELRGKGYETAICPSHTRPLLLDDLCMLATDAPSRIASPNTYKYEEWNKFSDAFYTSLFPSTVLMHEFYFNEKFSSWCNSIISTLQRPELYVTGSNPLPNNYIVCFIGANTRSRQWPVEKWIEFIEMIRKNYSLTVVIAGGAKEEIFAEEIASKTEVHNIVNKVSLPKLAEWIASSIIVISNNTMAAHLSVSCNRPTIIVANGDNFYSFTAYKEAGIENVITVYTKHFLSYWKKKNYQPFEHYIAVTKDISTIPAEDVYNAFRAIAKQNGVHENQPSR